VAPEAVIEQLEKQRAIMREAIQSSNITEAAKSNLFGGKQW
jgi:hypothetical protein